MNSEIPLKNNRSLLIISAEPQDAKSVIDYLNQVGGETDNLTFGKNQFKVSVEEESEFLRKARDTNLNLILCGILESRIVSVASLMRGDLERLKHSGALGISVLKEYWGLGIGGHMMQAVLDWARQNGVWKIDLQVRVDNVRAIKLYEWIGFQREGLHPKALLVDGVFHDQLSMGLWIG